MYEEFLFLGILYSCGSIKSKRVIFQTKRKELANLIYEASKKITKTKIKAKKIYLITSYNFEEKLNFKIDKNKLPIELLDEKEKIKNFLIGYFEGKSSISIKKRLIKVSGKKEILEQLKSLLEKVDINARVYKTGKYYALYIEGKNKCKIFMDKLGFLSEDKNNLLRKLVLYY